MLKKNRVDILNFDLWDADTGEADIIFKASNGLELKAFSLDDFEVSKNIDVFLSIFPKNIELVNKDTENKCENISNHFQIELIGDIEEIISDEEQGNFIIINFENILFSVFIHDEYSSFKISDKIKISGRLDIEKPYDNN